jgi:signal transduction histidine kinase/HAMP domain-containing protein/MFS family permease
MPFQLSLFTNSVGLELPQSLVAWGLIFLYVIILYWRLAQWQQASKPQQKFRPAVFVMLFILVPFCSLLLAFTADLPGGNGNSIYSISGNPLSLPVLVSIPWMLAAGLANPIQAVLLGFVSGSFVCLFSSHSLFIPFEYALLALIYSELLRTRYRGWIYRFLRAPFWAGMAVGLCAVLLSMLDGLLGGSNVVPLLMTSNTIWVVGVYAIMVLSMALGGLVCQFAARFFKEDWVKPAFLMPTPDEKLITRRFLTGIGPIIFGLLLLLLVGIWLTVGYSARQVVREKMAGSAEVAANTIPFFTNTGQNLIIQFARAVPLNVDSKDVQIVLSQSLASSQFFSQLIYIDAGGHIVATAPEKEVTISQAEETGLQKASQGLLYGKYATFPVDGSSSVLISFIAPVKDGQGKDAGYLLGRTDLAGNPSTQAVITLLNNFSQNGGEGYIVDENGSVIYHPNPTYIQSHYPGELSQQEEFYTLTSADSTPLLIYYKPSPDHDWSVVFSLPAGEIQIETWRLALPLVMLVLLVAGLVYLVIRSGLTSITHAVRQLTEEAERISRGQYDHVQYVRGEDEIGQLGQAFEQMRLNVKDKVEEMSLLLKVSQGMATNLDVESAVQPILEAAMSNGASMARIVLVPDSSTDPLNEDTERHGLGETIKYYSYLDDQILALTRSRDVIMLNNLMRGRALKLNPENLNPSAIVSVPLRTDGHFLGVLWVAYDQPRSFADSEVQFLRTLADDVSLALANIRLYHAAELGRQRLESILNSTPDPVMVIDNNDRIMLANPPAVELFERREFFVEGKAMDDVVASKVLLELLHSRETEKEIHFPNHQVFYAHQSSMYINRMPAGRICILRDITHFKEVDTLKTEFVATVSHDLRAPLTLMRGYATMLQMVGELNDQQKNYSRKIITGVEGMAALVNNLLDLGRIEAGMALQPAPVKAQAIVNKVMNTLSLQAVQKNITITPVFPEDSDPEVFADQPLVEQALNNLVENGIKYTPVGGQVTITVRDNHSKVVFEVRDTGIGIAPLDIPKLFEKFFRSSQRDGFYQKGSSLGLSIVKSIAERHNGRVWVDSQLGKGSTFYLEIPAYIREESTTSETSREGEEED